MRKYNQGFTIIEIIFALALLAVGLAEVVVIMGEGQFHNNLNRMNTIALGLAKERMEIIRNMSYIAIQNDGPTQYGSPYQGYFYQVTVTSIPPGPMLGQIKDVVVNVSFVAAKQATNPSVNLETYIANY